MQRPPPKDFSLKETKPHLGGGKVTGEKLTSTYDLVEQMQYLYVGVVKAKDLLAKDSTGSCDPYVEVKLGNDRGTARHFEKKSNPEWNQVWFGIQSDEAFSEAWHSDAASTVSEVDALANIRSKVYLSPKLWYVRVKVIEAQDLIPSDKGRYPEVFVKVIMGTHALRTRVSQSRSINPKWNEDLMLVVAEPFEEPSILSVEDRVAPNKDEVLGRYAVPLQYLDKRFDHRPMNSRWLNLEKHVVMEGGEKKEIKFASKIHMRICLEGGCHVLDESTHYSRDIRPTAKQLWKPNIGVLELGIFEFLIRTAEATTTKQVVAEDGTNWIHIIVCASSGVLLCYAIKLITSLWIKKREKNSLVIEDLFKGHTHDEEMTEYYDCPTELIEEHINKNKLVVSQRGMGKAVDGLFAKRTVSIKRCAISKEAKNDIKWLKISDANTLYILRYYCHETDTENQCIYVAVEHFICNFKDLILLLKKKSIFSSRKKKKLSEWEKKVVEYTMENRKNLVPLWIQLLKNVVEGVAHLHSQKIIHRDLHPENVMIVCAGKKLIGKIGDLSIAWDGDNNKILFPHNREGKHREGWRAPEQVDQTKGETSKVDMFNLGCLIYYTLSNGEHPFGFSNDKIMDSYNLEEVKDSHEASDLIKKLLSIQPDSRPSAAEALKHPFFWTSNRKMKFLAVVGSHTYGWKGPPNGPPGDQAKANAIISIAVEATGDPTGKWRSKIDNTLLTHMETKGKKYLDKDLADLLRLMRNIKIHYNDLSAFKGVIGTDLFNYFDRQFPKLFMKVYNMAYTHCKGDDSFIRFF